MKLCVFAFEGHFRILQLAVMHAQQNLDIDSVLVLWDDGESAVPTNLPWPVLAYSEFADVRQFPRGWIRQQFAKLTLHRVLKEDCWINMDADVVIRNPASFSSNQWYVDPREGCQDYWAFMKYAFDIDVSETRWMTAIWKCERSVLESMDQHLQTHHGCNIETAFVRSEQPVLSEVETYAFYATQKMEQKFERLPIGTRMVAGEELATVWDQSNEDLCLSNRDTGTPREFWSRWPEIKIDRK